MNKVEDFFLLKNVDCSWEPFFADPFVKNELLSIFEKINEQLNILPERSNILRVFKLPVEKIKVIIVGQDPYYKRGIADGIAFSTQKSKFLPLTLRNILKELASDIECNHPRKSGNLEDWFEQGVFLINTALTVEEENPLSHSKLWQRFTDLLIKYIKENSSDLVWVFWGRQAKEIRDKHQINNELSISSVHPSPLSAKFGFFGSKPFSLVNKKLSGLNKSPIIWCSACNQESN